MNTLSRTARVLQYFAQRAPGGVLGLTQALKLAYLSDLFAREYIGAPITELRYIRYKHGPFDQRIYAAVEELEDAKLVEETRVWFWSGRWKRELRLRAPVARLGFSDTEEAILEFVGTNYERLPLQKLLDEVYATEPMRRVIDRGEYNVPLPMEEVDNCLRDSFDLPALVAEEQEVKRGNYVLADEFFDALRIEAVAWDEGRYPGVRT